MNEELVKQLGYIQGKLEGLAETVSTSSISIPVGSAPTNYYDIQRTTEVVETAHLESLIEIILNVVNVLILEASK